MTAVVSVERVREATQCRRCDKPIEPGRRAVLVLGAGLVHLRCVVDVDQADEDPAARPAPDGNRPVLDTSGQRRARADKGPGPVAPWLLDPGDDGISLEPEAELRRQQDALMAMDKRETTADQS